MEAVFSAIRAVVGDVNLLTADDLRAGYEVDFTGRYRGEAPAVVRPGTAAECAAVITLCADAGVAVVPQGGNTGLVGGSVPLAGEVVVSTRRLTDIGPVDRLAGQVTVGAGVTLADAQSAAASAGLSLGIDLAARDSATIGGMVATNAGGTAYVRHGGMRAQVAGVEAVLGDGSLVAHLGGLAKDNTGYDLAGLLCGSEGTLGIITAVRLRLVSPPRRLVTALAGVDGVGGALDAVAALRDAGVALEAAEIVLGAAMDLVCRVTGRRSPVAPAPAYLLVEWDGEPEWLAAVPALADAVVVEDAGRRQELWAYRDLQTEAVMSLGVPHKLDVSLPASAMAAFVERLPAVVERVAPAAVTSVFGHVADGNLHVNVVGPPADDFAADDAVLRLVASLGGSISAEHGVGTAKKQWLHLVRSEAEIAAFRRIKSALDPTGILNPNCLLPSAPP